MSRYLIECILQEVPLRRMLFVSEETVARKIADLAGDDPSVSGIVLKRQTCQNEVWETVDAEVIK